MGGASETFMQAAGLVSILLYVLSSFRVFPGRTTLWLQRAAIVALGLAILVAGIETIRWFAGVR